MMVRAVLVEEELERRRVLIPYKLSWSDIEYAYYSLIRYSGAICRVLHRADVYDGGEHCLGGLSGIRVVAEIEAICLVGRLVDSQPGLQAQLDGQRGYSRHTSVLRRGRGSGEIAHASVVSQFYTPAGLSVYTYRTCKLCTRLGRGGATGRHRHACAGCACACRLLVVATLLWLVLERRSGISGSILHESNCKPRIRSDDRLNRIATVWQVLSLGGVYRDSV
jgi:hypothetical protein